MRPAWLAMAVVLTAAGCGGGADASDPSTASAACAEVVAEDLDPMSSLHVSVDSPVDFLTWPPTSGPHVGAPPLSGVQDEPLPGVVQVSALEQGSVLIQHEGLSADAVTQVDALAGSDVVVAPGVDLPSPVVATAWLHKQECDAVDVPTLEAFIAEHARG